MAVGRMPPPPPWLRVLVAMKDIYEDICETHPSQYKTYFCRECMVECLCPTCYPQSIHNHHPSMRTFRASTKPALDINHISEFWNVDEIQTFSINARTVVFLQERESKKPNGINACRVCRAPLMQPGFKFCSIECQMRSAEMNGEEVNVAREEVTATPQRSSLNNRILHGVRKRSPKPHRVAAVRELIKPHRVAAVRELIKPHRVAAVRELILEAGRRLEAAAGGCRDEKLLPKGRKRPRKGVPRRAVLV